MAPIPVLFFLWHVSNFTLTCVFMEWQCNNIFDNAFTLIGSSLHFTTPKNLWDTVSVAWLFNWAGTPNIEMLVLTFFCYCVRNTQEKGKGITLSYLKRAVNTMFCRSGLSLPAKTYLCKDMMTRLLTSISFRSTLDTMAAVDFLNNLARKPFVCSY